MNKYLLFLLLIFISSIYGYEKKSIVERYTNASCGPCASVNNAWYTATTHDLVATGQITHVVYNVNWPGANDPMYLLNSADNAIRWSYYGVNAVPWINVNGSNVGTGSSAPTVNAVTNGNAEFAPFKIVLTPEYFSNNSINVHVKVLRDPSDTTTNYNKTRLRVALTERTVAFSSPPGSNGESVFYSICRKMLPEAKGLLLEIPAAGDSVEYNLFYVPSAQFLSSVHMDSIRVAAFIQNDETKFVYQSAMENIVSSSSINAAFTVDEYLGAEPLEAHFTDYSTGTNGNAITSWQWDFNGDGIIDATTQNPTYTYNQKGYYTVSLTVSDGTNEKTRTIKNMISIIGKTADILFVNGIDNGTYTNELRNFIDSSACFGNHDVDVWDLFGDQGVDYSRNSKIKQLDLYNRKIPNSILKLYEKVVWIGNNYSGDLNYFDQQQVVDYVKAGGNFLLGARMGSQFLNNQLKSYCGINSFTGDLTVTGILPSDTGLVGMNSVGTNSLVHLVKLEDTSTAVTIFTNANYPGYAAGFRMHKDGEGTFTFIAGRPYRYDLTASKQNYDYIIENYMISHFPTNVNHENNSAPKGYYLDQNYPNPFNPSTVIRYSLPYTSNIKIMVYNVIGQLVDVLADGVKPAGNYEQNFNASKLSSGVYLYTIQASSLDGKNNFFNTKKMLFIK